MHLALFTPQLPPAADGIGDYTYYLAEALAQHTSVTLLTGAGKFLPPAGARIDTSAFRPGAQLLQSLPLALRRHRPDWLIVQYNPFSYSDRGINPWLAESLGLSRRILPDLKIALMGHELFVPRSNWKHNILSGLQRAQLWGILQQVDCSFGAITTWTQILHRWAPRKPTVLLPVGSNIPVAPPLPNSAKQAFRARLGIPPATLILGAFGTAHHAKLQNLILWTFEQLDRAGCPVHLLALGSGGAAMAAACPELLKPSLSATGFLRAQEISQHLQLMDLLLVPFADGLSTRRGSAIAGLAHGIPTLSTLGSNTDPLWVQQFALGLAPLEFQAFLDRTRYLLDHPEIRARHAQVGRELYEQYFAWEQISAQLMANLTKMSKTKKGL